MSQKLQKSVFKKYFSDVSQRVPPARSFPGARVGSAGVPYGAHNRSAEATGWAAVLRHLLTIVEFRSGEVTCGVRKHHSEV